MLDCFLFSSVEHSHTLTTRMYIRDRYTTIRVLLEKCLLFFQSACAAWFLDGVGRSPGTGSRLWRREGLESLKLPMAVSTRSQQILMWMFLDRWTYVFFLRSSSMTEETCSCDSRRCFTLAL